MIRRIPAVALLAFLSTAPDARAEDLLPPTAADLGGVRAAALGAYRGLAGGNDEIFLNAAALAARRRYSVETHWMTEGSGPSKGQFLTLSTVDSQMGDVAGGFAYTRVVSGPSVGNVYHAAFASSLGSLFGGVTGKYFSLSGADSMRAATVDASLFAPIGRLLSVGIAGYNLIPVGHRDQAPRALGAGAAFGDDATFHVTADWRRDFERRSRRTDAYAFGGELLLGRYFPVRAGWLADGTRGARFWSVGAGLVTTAGFAFDLLYRQAVQTPSDKTFGVALKLFLLE